MSDGATQRSERQFATIEYLSSIWGILSFVLILGPLVLLFPPVDARLKTISATWVSVPIALVCGFVIAFYIMTLRDELFKFTRTRSFSEKPKPHLAALALTTFVIFILLSFFLAFGAASADQMIAKPGAAAVSGKMVYGGTAHMLLKLLMTGFQVFMFVFLSLSAGLMAAYKYGKSIDVSGPNAPIYTDENRLREKALSQACKELGIGLDELTVSDMKRLPGGGIKLTLHHKGELIEENDQQFREDKIWIVEADHRGQLLKVEEQTVRQGKVEAFRINPVLDAVQEILNSDVHPTIAGMKRGRGGDVTLTLKHQGKTWEAKADRWSRLIGLEEKAS
jgi:hypothetical protein